MVTEGAAAQEVDAAKLAPAVGEADNEAASGETPME